MLSWTLSTVSPHLAMTSYDVRSQLASHRCKKALCTYYLASQLATQLRAQCFLHELKYCETLASQLLAHFCPTIPLRYNHCARSQLASYTLVIATQLDEDSDLTGSSPAIDSYVRSFSMVQLSMPAYASPSDAKAQGGPSIQGGVQLSQDKWTGGP